MWLQNSQYDGLQMLEMMLRDNPDQQVVMISGHATFDMAVRATKMGAYDFLLKIVTRDIYAYERFFFGRLSALEEIQDVTSSVALSEIKAGPALPI